jgi:hypothetical protein
MRRTAYALAMSCGRVATARGVAMGSATVTEADGLLLATRRRTTDLKSIRVMKIRSRVSATCR